MNSRKTTRVYKRFHQRFNLDKAALMTLRILASFVLVSLTHLPAEALDAGSEPDMNPFAVDYKLKRSSKPRRKPVDRSKFKLVEPDSPKPATGKTSSALQSTRSDKTEEAIAGALQGKLEVTDWKAMAVGDIFKAAVAQMRKTNFPRAAKLYGIAGTKLGKGQEALLAEAKYYEAGCFVMLGENEKAIKLYRRAWGLFQKYDPLSPHAKTTLEQLCNLTVSRMRLAKIHKLEKMQAVHIDRNITLLGKVENDGSPLSAMVDVDNDFVHNSVHKSFVEMTCLETAELGSNSTNADYRWLPLLAQKKRAIFSKEPEQTLPRIKVKINQCYYSVNVDLPDIKPGIRTIMLVTNGEKICAIEPSTHETWLLLMKFDKKSERVNSFEWKKLLHQKNRHFS